MSTRNRDIRTARRLKTAQAWTWSAPPALDGPEPEEQPEDWSDDAPVPDDRIPIGPLDVQSVWHAAVPHDL